jgi:hypothetical protein
MMTALRSFTDKFLGRGDAAITVPVFDGALKSNRLIEDAHVVQQLEAPSDLATDGKEVFVADGANVLAFSLDQDGRHQGRLALSMPAPITALCCLAQGGLAVALDGKAVSIHGGPHDGLQWSEAGGRPLHAVNALAPGDDGTLLATEGSSTRSVSEWKHDLMELGHTGRVCELRLASGQSTQLAGPLRHAFGLTSIAGQRWVSESWRHRVIRLQGNRLATVIDNLPGYPSRMSPALGGGIWLTCFTLRTQLVEFVLREPEFRRRMLKEVDPAFWIAPALSSGNTFLEPMQGAHLKMMGVVKPWAPPRSYGLVIRLDDQGLIRYSLHSRFDGRNHGISAAVQCGDDLYLLALGSRRLLRLSVAEAERSLSV